MASTVTMLIMWLSIIQFISLWFTIRLIHGAKCGVLSSDLIDCAHKHGIDRIPSDSVGYGFGFGSIDAVEKMCRTKWHLKVYACAHQTVLARCSTEKNSHFRERMWQFMFDTTRYARAALYFCKSHNLKIFRMHRFACFSPLEASAEVCSRKYAQTLSATTKRLATNSPANMTNEASYADYMQREITQTYCTGTIEKINCVSQVLKHICSPDAIELIRNYYRETLPENCAHPMSRIKLHPARVLPSKRATVIETHSLQPSPPVHQDKPDTATVQNLSYSSSSSQFSLFYLFLPYTPVDQPTRVANCIISTIFVYTYFVLLYT